MSQDIHLIIGSTRQNRVGGAIAEWLQRQAKNAPNAALKTIDLKDVALPPFDAPIPPAYVPTETEAGKAWASQIGSAERFIFLTPEYNRSIPSSLKNALDYLVAEWKNKPAAIISYGYVDGGQSATNHLTDILQWLKLDIADKNITIALNQQMFAENGTFQDIDSALADYKEPVQNLFAALLSSHASIPAA